ncbi:MAG: nucleotidyl transferase AbiEii/AbiGii toxin family protein [Acidobacteria bacterium]|nr:nucleotidyl transferase AbiEii/AbiGii toxin family protein [Acidobacteriota bacterium]
MTPREIRNLPASVHARLLRVARRRGEYPTLLDFPAPKVLAYPREAVVAEKTQAMIELGLLNSRLKDYFDVSYLAQTYEFDGTRLQEALEATLRRRDTPVPEGRIEALEPEFAADADKQAQWYAFQRRADLPREELSAVVQQVRNFVELVLLALATRDAFDKRWPAGGPWKH